MTAVYLHVGAPKSGTTYLQDILFHYREAIGGDGVLYPAQRFDDHFFAAVDLQGLAFYGVARPEAEGFWDRVAARARDFEGTVVISHDVFADASTDDARRAVESLQPAEVHVVYTARDLVRQVPSQWHEDIKHGRHLRFEDYLDEVMHPEAGTEAGERFWRAHDPVDVLGRWGAELPPARVHIVTVPRPGASRTLLWKRFAGLVGLVAERYDVAGVGRANQALGIAETELLRRVNIALGKRIGQVPYEHVVKGVLAHRILDERPGAERPGLPPDRWPWFAERSREQVARLRAAGYDVVGDLAELLPEPPPTDEFRHPDEVGDSPVAAAGVHATAELLLETEQLWEKARRDTAALQDLRQRLDAADSVIREHQELPGLERIKRTVVEIGRRNPTVERMLNMYRGVRVRSRPGKGT